MRAAGSAGFGSGEHGVDAKLLDRVERNREADVRLLRLIDDIGSVDAIVSEVVVIAPPTGKSNRALVAPSRVDSAGNQRTQCRPIAAVQGQFLRLLPLNAST